MVWDKPRIKSELKRLYRAGHNRSYNALAKKKQSLVSAAAYHFGSYRAAVEAACVETGRDPAKTMEVRFFAPGTRPSDFTLTWDPDRQRAWVDAYDARSLEPKGVVSEKAGCGDRLLASSARIASS